ncbi:hypothetical protein AADR41_25400 [Streptomyces sp. CLV115]|uniref:hypothetical protein n=1 Tax=Streptomyces sp. CLV115 TaxID=3138502 RepID=UPI00313CC2E8
MKFDVLGTMRAIRDDKSLSTTQKAFMFAAVLRTDNKSCKVRMSLEGLAEDVKSSSKTAYRVFAKENENVLRYFSKVERNSRSVDLWFHPLPDTVSVIDEDTESPNEVDGHSVHVDGHSVPDEGHSVLPSTYPSTLSSTKNKEELETRKDEGTKDVDSSPLSSVVTDSPLSSMEKDAAEPGAVVKKTRSLFAGKKAELLEGRSTEAEEVEVILGSSEHEAEARRKFNDPNHRPDMAGALRARWCVTDSIPEPVAVKKTGIDSEEW